MFEDPFRQRFFCAEGVRSNSFNMEFSREGDGRSGEIEGKPLLVDDDLYDMGVEPILHFLNPCHQSRHGEGVVLEERYYRLVDGRSFDERFVSLDINDDFRSELLGHLCYPVGSSKMVWRSHRYPSPKPLNSL